MDKNECLTWLKILRANMNTFPEVSAEKKIEALTMAIKALERIPKLQNRCHVLTHGVICGFCPYECEYRSEAEPQESGG